MRQYETIDISGDAGIRAFGLTPAELFANAAMGMYSLMVDPETVRAAEQIKVSVRHESFDGLLVAWLNDLIFRFDVRNFIAKEITATISSSANEAEAGEKGYLLSALLSGEIFDLARHKGKLLVKAATYHNLKVGRHNGQWIAEVIFDI